MNTFVQLHFVNVFKTAVSHINNLWIHQTLDQYRYLWCQSNIHWVNNVRFGSWYQYWIWSVPTLQVNHIRLLLMSLNIWHIFLCLCPCVSRWWGERGLSVTCPHSELRPLPFLCGSPVPVLFTGKSLCSTLCPSQFSPVDLYFQCKSYLLVIGLWAFAYASLLVRCCHPDGVQTLTAALCFQIATHTYTLETLINKSLKHLVTLIMCCQSELCSAPSLSIRCWQLHRH